MKRDPFIAHLIAKHHRPAFLDEVGMGAIFGEHVACAVVIPEPFRMSQVNDSKQLKHEDIYKLAPKLRRKVIFSFGIVTSEELNGIRNMHRANQLAMLRAVQGLPEKSDALFVDGKHPLDAGIPSYAVIKGDTKVFGIAVASIIAKDFRDHLVMDTYGMSHAKYKIMSNKGYRSPDHLMALRKWGVSGPHRKWMPQVKHVLSGGYDNVIQVKHKHRWSLINE